LGFLHEGQGEKLGSFDFLVAAYLLLFVLPFECFFFGTGAIQAILTYLVRSMQQTKEKSNFVACCVGDWGKVLILPRFKKRD